MRRNLQAGWAKPRSAARDLEEEKPAKLEGGAKASAAEAKQEKLSSGRAKSEQGKVKPASGNKTVNTNLMDVLQRVEHEETQPEDPLNYDMSRPGAGRGQHVPRGGGLQWRQSSVHGGQMEGDPARAEPVGTSRCSTCAVWASCRRARARQP